MKSVALRDELIGTWKLVSYVETLVDGSPWVPKGYRSV